MINTAAVEATIKRLEQEVESKREGFMKKATIEVSRELDEKQAEIDRLRRALEYEQELKAEARLKYRTSIPLDSDFERLWATKLRDEAMLENADMDARVEAASRHPIYRSF
jgi:hypothetical protein